MDIFIIHWRTIRLDRCSDTNDVVQLVTYLKDTKSSHFRVIKFTDATPKGL